MIFESVLVQGVNMYNCMSGSNWYIIAFLDFLNCNQATHSQNSDPENRRRKVPVIVNDPMTLGEITSRKL